MGNNSANLAWSIAKILRGTSKPTLDDYVRLPLSVRRRLDCVLERSKEALAKAAEVKMDPYMPLDTPAHKVPGPRVFYSSKFAFTRHLGDPRTILTHVVQASTEAVRLLEPETR
ncbi:hypothetical protein [Arthrobacter sp. NPDC056727]|uniref:hypothetical protein n=1 Tax=Arthrobacter sp. NPDC056727 TaxID=3345927 RepID=UPI00366B954C